MTSTMLSAVDAAADRDQAGRVPPGRGDEPGGPSSEGAAARLSRELFSDEALDQLVARAGDGQVRLTGPGGFLPELIARVLERGMGAELSDHLGYDRGDPAGRGSPNSRNGSTPKTLRTEVGDVPIATPRDRAGTFEPRLVPKGTRRLDGLDAMIISLYSGGMTVRDIQAHLARTLGTELSHETIANVTDAVAEEVKAWQSRPLDPVWPVVFLDALVVKVRDGAHVVNRSAHIAVGVDTDGVKHVLGDLGAAGRGREDLGRGLRPAGQPGRAGRADRLLRRPGGTARGIEATWPHTVVQ